MLDFDAHAQLADATAALMRSCALAAAQTMNASACRGLTLWSDMLRAPDPRPPLATARARVTDPFEMLQRVALADWGSRTWLLGAWSASPAAAFGWAPMAVFRTPSPSTSWPMWGNWAGWQAAMWPVPDLRSSAFEPARATPAPSAAASYATYRSPGGHAVAQVISPAADDFAADMAAKAVLMHVQTMLGAWRAALRMGA